MFMVVMGVLTDDAGTTDFGNSNPQLTTSLRVGALKVLFEACVFSVIRTAQLSGVWWLSARATSSVLQRVP